MEVKKKKSSSISEKLINSGKSIKNQSNGFNSLPDENIMSRSWLVAQQVKPPFKTTASQCEMPVPVPATPFLIHLPAKSLDSN